MAEQKKNYKGGIKSCIAIIKDEFQSQLRSKENRSTDEQTIIGNLLTSIEIEVTKKMKKLLDR